MRIGSVVLRRVTFSGPNTVIDGADRRGVDALRLLMVLSGRVTVIRPRSTPVAVAAGDALFAMRGLAYRAATDSTAMVSTTVPLADLPANLRRPTALPISPLGPSPLIDAIVGTTTTLLDRAGEPMGFDPTYAAHGLINLQSALLARLLDQGPASGPDHTYRRAVDLIEHRLTDPDLRPPVVALEIGVSVRYLHLAFAHRGTSVARHIKSRRIECVAAGLEGGGSLAELATRYGFSSPVALARVLREAGVQA